MTSWSRRGGTGSWLVCRVWRRRIDSLVSGRTFFAYTWRGVRCIRGQVDSASGNLHWEALDLYPPHLFIYTCCMEQKRSAVQKRRAPLTRTLPYSSPRVACPARLPPLLPAIHLVLPSNPKLGHDFSQPDAPSLSNEAHQSQSNVLDLIVVVQQLDVCFHDCVGLFWMFQL